MKNLLLTILLLAGVVFFIDDWNAWLPFPGRGDTYWLEMRLKMLISKPSRSRPANHSFRQKKLRQVDL